MNVRIAFYLAHVQFALQSEQHAWGEVAQYDSRVVQQPEAFDAVAHSFDGST